MGKHEVEGGYGSGRGDCCCRCNWDYCILFVRHRGDLEATWLNQVKQAQVELTGGLYGCKSDCNNWTNLLFSRISCRQKHFKQHCLLYIFCLEVFWAVYFLCTSWHGTTTSSAAFSCSTVSCSAGPCQYSLVTTQKRSASTTDMAIA